VLAAGSLGTTTKKWLIKGKVEFMSHGNTYSLLLFLKMYTFLSKVHGNLA
jgi:hypothetical protein